jgi:hypothetical protein
MTYNFYIYAKVDEKVIGSKQGLYFTNILCAAFLNPSFLGLYFFWRKNIGAKAALKMLAKLTTGDNFWCTELGTKDAALFHHQNRAQLYHCKKIEAMPNFNAFFCTLYSNKARENHLAHKLLVEC